MRLLISLLLFFSLTYQCFVKLGVLAWFEYNRNYIAQNLCENKDKPEKKCCGKCVLRKQLKKADVQNTGNRTLPAKWEKGEITTFILPQSSTIFRFSPVEQLGYLLSPVHFNGYDPVASIFHPPPVCC